MGLQRRGERKVPSAKVPRHSFVLGSGTMTRTQQIILLVLLIVLAVAQYLLREGYLKPWSSLTGQALAPSGLVWVAVRH